MFKAPDCDGFIQNQASEIHGLENLNIFEYHNMFISPPPVGSKLLNSKWSHHCKQKPAGKFLKFKARICTDGSQQQVGIDYWDTYTTVIDWNTIFLILILSTILN
jgi:hypothetical protein